MKYCDYLYLFRIAYIISFCMMFEFSSVIGQTNRLYIANDDHTDYMWTANEAGYDSAFVKMLDYYLKEIDLTRNNPDDFQARFNCDGSYWLKAYERNRSPEQFNRLINAIRSGHISSPLNSLVSTYGAQPTEAVIRGMYDAGEYERRFGLRFKMAIAMENQTLPLGLSSIWSGAGAKYSWKGVCGCATKMTKGNFGARQNQLYYYTGLDDSRILMKWYNLGWDNTHLGGYAEVRRQFHPKSNDVEGNIKNAIHSLDSLCRSKKNYPYHIAGAFGYGWDDLETFVSKEYIQAAKEMTDKSRSVRVSNQVDFFEDILKSYSDFPSETVSYGNEWDTYSVSMNETTAKVRRSTELLRNAEMLAALVPSKNRKYYSELSNERKKAWESLGLYWEHDWTADGNISHNERANWQNKLERNISAYVDTLLAKGVYAFGKQLKRGKDPRFYIANSLSWIRDDVADIPYDGVYPCQVVDLQQNSDVPSQIIYNNGMRYLRVFVTKVPALGYKVFEIRPKQLKRFSPNAAIVENNYISNDYFKIKLLPSGAITEIFDRKLNRQLVKKTNGRYCNDIGIDSTKSGKLEVENAGSVSVTLKAVAGDSTKRVVRITLYSGIPRIDIEDSLQANFTDLKTWSFSFNLNNPEVNHEELAAVLKAKLQSNGGHYATKNARYDWLTFNHFADANEGNYGITLSNVDCSFFKIGNSTSNYLDENSGQINALAGGQTDPFKDFTRGLGIYGQNGNSNFRYRFSLTSYRGPFKATKAMKFALSHQNPLIAGLVTGDKNANKNVSSSLLAIDNPNVLIWAVKPSEEKPEKALIVRVWNMEDSPILTTLSLPKSIEAAFEVSHIETKENRIRHEDSGLSISSPRIK